MRRKRPEEEHENLERWLVSYADFITLLFAFFVVMYAISSINEGKYRVLSDALMSAFREQPGSPRLVVLDERSHGILPGGGDPIGEPGSPGGGAEGEAMKQAARSLMRELAPLVQQGQARVEQTAQGLSVELSASALFASGEAALQANALPALEAVARVLAGTKNDIRVEGHTDNVPINVPLYPSNWELSSARAGTVVRLLSERGVASERLSAVGYADTRPIDSNASAEGRARNRRVNILILHEPE